MIQKRCSTLHTKGETVLAPASLVALVCCLHAATIFGYYFIAFVQQLQSLGRGDIGGNRMKVVGRFRGRNGERLNQQDPAIELKGLTHHLPVASAHFLLLDDKPTPLVEPAQNAPAEVHILEQGAIDLREAPPHII